MRAGDFGCHRPATRWRQNDDNRNHAGKIRSARRRFFGLANGIHFNLSLNRYKEVVHAAADHRPPADILAELGTLEDEILREMAELGRCMT